MNNQVIKIPRVHVEEIRNEVASRFGAEHSFVVEPPQEGLKHRPQMGQFDLVSVVVGAVSSVALQEIVNYVKERIKKKKEVSTKTPKAKKEGDDA